MTTILLALTAHAQEGSAWRPAAGATFGRGGTIAESARVEEGEAGVSLTTALADGPLASGVALVPIASVAASDRLRVDVAVAVWPFAQTDAFTGLASGAAGVQALVPVTRGKTAFSLIPRLIFPTGTDAARLEGGPAAGMLLALERGDRLVWTVNAGPAWSPPQEIAAGTHSGSTFALAGTGAWHPTPGFQAGAEAAGWIGLGGGVSSGELLAFGRGRRADGLGLGVGAGASLGAWAPVSRIVATLSWAPGRSEPPDPDGDGLVRGEDACPTAAEDLDGWVDDDGCPEADNDRDAVGDATDACPDVHGPATADGCPDSDGDGRHDGIDRCIAVAGPAKERADLADGCPKRAWATARRVDLAGPIRFDLSGSLVDGADDLAAAAAYLLAHPELGRVEVGGHVASGRPEAEAIGVSRVRALRVVEILVAAGVPAERLTTVGYGATKPLDTNRIASGRAKNERIAFLLLDAPATPVTPAPPPP